VKQFLHDLYFSMYSFVAQGGYLDHVDAHTRAGYLLAYVVEFSTCVFIALYTANMASIFSATPQSSLLVTGVEDILHTGGTLCYRAGTTIASQLTFAASSGVFPPSLLQGGAISVDFNAANYDQAWKQMDLEAVARMEKRECLGYVLPEWIAQDVLLGDANKACNLRLVEYMGTNRGGYITASEILRRRSLGGHNLDASGNDHREAVCAAGVVEPALGAIFRKATNTVDQPIRTFRGQHQLAAQTNACRKDGSKQAPPAKTTTITVHEVLGLFIITFIASGGLIFLSPHGRQTFRVYLINPVLHLLGWGLSEAAKKAQLDEYNQKYARRPPFSERLMGSKMMKEASHCVDGARQLTTHVARSATVNVNEMIQLNVEEAKKEKRNSYEPSGLAAIAAMADEMGELVVGDSNFHRAVPTGSAAHSASGARATSVNQMLEMNEGLHMLSSMKAEQEMLTSHMQEILKFISNERKDYGGATGRSIRVERVDHVSSSSDSAGQRA